MKKSLVAIVLSCFAFTLQADESIGLQFPSDDARAAVAAGKFEFVALNLASGMHLPGLNDDQIEVVNQKYIVRPLNHRWSSYSNIEDREDELSRIRSYAHRYNMTMWTEVEQQKIRDFKKYRY